MSANEKRCPQCAQTVKLDALCCRHCGHAFDPKAVVWQKQKRDRNRLGSGLGCLVLLAVLIVGFWSIGSDDVDGNKTEPDIMPKPSTLKAPIPLSDEQRAQAERDANAMFPPISLPKGVPDAPVTGSCDTKLCFVRKVQFERRDWPMAWQGDYQAQRNVAFCRASGCGGGVATDKIEACAWRVVVSETNALKSSDLDNDGLRHDCGSLDALDADMADQKAEAIVAIIER